LTGTLVSPAVERVDDTLKAFLVHFISQTTVVKCDVQDAIDVIPETLVLPEHF
jgi:hypothetical protein